MKQEDFDTLVNNLKTQNNRSTQDPLFCVEQKQRTWGIDPDYHDGKYEWVDPDGTDGTFGTSEDLREHLIENGYDLIEGLKETELFKDYSFPDDLDEETLDALFSEAGIVLDMDDEIKLGNHEYRKCGYVDEYVFVTAHFTEAAALQYIEENSHNLTDPRTFVTSQYRCDEWIALRKALIEGKLVLAGSKTEKIRKGQLLETKDYGPVRFDGFDFHMGQKTLKLYSDEFRQTFYPLPEEIEAQGYEFFDG
jgi:hypothetical protein